MHDVFLNMVFIMFLRTVSQTDERKNFVVAVEMKRFLFAFGLPLFAFLVVQIFTF